MDRRSILNGELAVSSQARRLLMAMQLLTRKTDAVIIAELLDKSAEAFIEHMGLREKATVLDMEIALRELSGNLRG